MAPSGSGSEASGSSNSRRPRGLRHARRRPRRPRDAPKTCATRIWSRAQMVIRKERAGRVRARTSDDRCTGVIAPVCGASIFSLPPMAAAPFVLLLVAPDDADHRLVRDLLEDADELHRVTTVGAALAAEEEHSHDVVLLAAEAEAEDGDALRRLVEEGARTPVIVLDDESGPAQIDEATGRGAVDHLPRRVLTAETLHRAVRYAVEHRRTVDRLRHDVLHDALTGL